MKQVTFRTYGNADVLELVDAPKPAPGEGDLLIEVEASGVNYSDILRRKNTYFMPTPLPYVLGVESVGRIVELGRETNGFKEGERVLALLPYGGGYAEYVTSPAHYCIPLPEHIDSREATALFVQGTTAHLMLTDVVSSVKDSTVLVHAAAGGVGSILVQLATQMGARVIATGSSSKKLAHSQSLGAIAGVNYTKDGWAEQVIRANDGEKVDILFEMVGGTIYTESFGCLKPGGTMVVYGAASGQKGIIHSEHFVDENITVTGFNLAHYMQHRFDTWQKSMGALIQFLAEGKLNIKTDETFPLAKVAEAHRKIETRQSTGKVVLIPGTVN